MLPALELRNLRKTFGTTVAVEGMDLVVPSGALYGVIGPNGAGKTTCIRMIMSILFQDSGELSVLGRRSALEAKDRIGYLPEERGVYRKMKVGAFLIYMAQLKGMSADGATKRVPQLLQEIGLPGVEGKRCEDLSKGMLQRVQYLAAVINQPDLLILDEPFSGQDPVSVRMLRDHILKEHRRGATVLLSTHVMPNAEEMCQHVVMIHQGRKVLDEAMAGLRRQFDPRTIYFEPLNASANPSLLSCGRRRRARGADRRRLPDHARPRDRSISRHGTACLRRRAGPYRAGSSPPRGCLHPDRDRWSAERGGGSRAA